MIPDKKDKKKNPRKLTNRRILDKKNNSRKFYNYRKRKKLFKNKKLNKLQKHINQFRSQNYKQKTQIKYSKIFLNKIEYNLYVTITLNNIFLTYSDAKTNKVINVFSAGLINVKSYKKILPNTAFLLVKEFLKTLKKTSINICLIFKGIYLRKPILKTIIKNLETSDITIVCIKDLVPVAHNGSRMKKSKRL